MGGEVTAIGAMGVIVAGLFAFAAVKLWKQEREKSRK